MVQIKVAFSLDSPIVCFLFPHTLVYHPLSLPGDFTLHLLHLMKISSRSILSPGRTGYSREPPPISLSTSLSRRLSNSRSIKGGASPAMFPVTGKKRGCGFDNPEPSSPKVTCIGQVRVKTKKKHPKNLRNLSTRRTTGDVNNFRKLEQSRSQSQNLSNTNSNINQRWVHIPLTICEALRTFGSEVSCLFPCRSSCSTTTVMEDEEKMESKNGSCGAVFAKWLVAFEDGDIGERIVDEMEVGNLRRHVFDDLEIVNDEIVFGGKLDEARVSICVPPKNALLLMRCRSDPIKMEALTNRTTMSTVNEEQIAVYDEDVHLEDENIMVLEEEEEDDFFLGCLFEKNEIEDEDYDMEDAQEELFEEIETGESNIEKVKHFEEEIEVGNEDSLPECLLLMMYEPKLSMEVSKETWVSSSDFLKKKRSPPVDGSTDSQDELRIIPYVKETVMSADIDPQTSCQPARSSYSTMGFERVVLTRCKSEPMRSAADKLALEGCYRTKKLESPRRASFGVG